MHVAPATAAGGEQAGLHDRRPDDSAPHGHVERPPVAHQLELDVRAARAEDPADRARHIEAGGRRASDRHDRVADANAGALRRAGSQRDDDEPVPRGQDADADAGVVRRRLLPDEPVVRGSQIRRVRVAQRADHRVHGAGAEHLRRHRPVVAGHERLAYLVDDGRHDDGRGRAAAPRQVVAERERPGQHEPHRKEDERTPHVSRRPAYGRTAPTARGRSYTG